MEQKRKRGRPPKVHKSPLLQPLEFPASHLNETSARDLQYGFKILHEISNIPKSRLILDQPDENLFGLHDYYEIIKQPMWLAEITRKFEEKQYKDLKEVIADFRLVLENCYRFWGANHKFSKHTFRIEKILEKHLKDLPGNLKSTCNLIEISNDTSNESESSALLDGKFLKLMPLTRQLRPPLSFIREYQSKILQNLEKKAKTESELNKDVSEEELHKWETEILMSRHTRKQINAIAELADIGYFIKLTHQVLCVKPVTQFELERMLIMPKGSSTLATLMTAFLCPTAMRGSLYLKPLMTYEVWTTILSRKLDGWYNALMKVQDKIQMFLKYGIEPPFWEVVGEQNPLLTSEFQTLCLNKKAWILKTLCTTMFVSRQHSNKKIEEYFNTLEDCKLRGNIIYEDNKFMYVNEFSPEIRVYRIGKYEAENSPTSPENVNCSSINDVQDDPDSIISALSRKSKFCLVAYDKESLEALKTTFCRKKKSVQAVEKLLNTNQNDMLTVRGLRSMHFQWKKFVDRLPKVTELSRNYWINKITSQNQTMTGEDAGSTSNERGLIIFGKRPSKRKFSFQEINSSSSNDEKLSEDTISDWEDCNIRRSKRIRRSKTFYRQWERRFEESIYETHCRNYSDPTSSSSKGYGNINNNGGGTSKISNTDLTNPNDYVRFLQFQQQKINSFYNTKRNGLTIRKTLINPTRRSIVNAAVEKAAILEEAKVVHQMVLEQQKAPESKVLMISMASLAAGASTPASSAPVAQAAVDEADSSAQPPSSTQTVAKSAEQAILNSQETMCNLVSSSVNVPSVPQDANYSPFMAPLTDMKSQRQQSQSDVTPSSMVESFLSDWMLSKKSVTPVKVDFIEESMQEPSDATPSSSNLTIL